MPVPNPLFQRLLDDWEASQWEAIREAAYGDLGVPTVKPDPAPWPDEDRPFLPSEEEEYEPPAIEPEDMPPVDVERTDLF
jgi:hypothetical protein